MARYVASIVWASAASGNVFAVPHPGGLLAGPITVRDMWILSPLKRELRVNIKRYNSLASGGSSSGTVKGPDDAVSSSNAVIRYGVGLVVPDAQDLDCEIKTRMATFGVRENVFDAITFTVVVGHSLVVELVDGNPMGAESPLTFVLVWDE